jgi:hypothetical protein
LDRPRGRARGVPVHVVAAHAGHSSPSLTLDTYAHVLVDDREIDGDRVPS